MTESERFERVCAIFDAVRDVAPKQQAARLDALCADDAGLRSEVESMLSAHAEESPLDQPTEMPPGLGTPNIDRYEIGEQVGTGGMGVVYAARMRNPDRAVAIKVIKLGMNSERVIARFDLERQALARMEHPNIASVLDAGVTNDGRPYFAMELARGQTIVRHIRESQPGTKDRIGLMIQVCNAIQHAHQKGIIHRDIKPSNIIVTESDGRMIPKVIDFGIAKAIQDDLGIGSTVTMHAQAIGTPAYMSPEQADPLLGDVDTRTDVYSLGVVLYELLTGSTPISDDELSSKSYPELVQYISERDPPRPSVRLATMQQFSGELVAIDAGQLKGDLDWIVMKCLEKEPARRYETASALGADLERFLSDEPVLARPASRAYVARKFVRRHRGGVIATGVVLGTLVLGIAGTTAGLIWALNEKERAERFALAEQRAQEEANESSERALSEAKAAQEISEFFILDVLGSADPSRSSDRDLTVREALMNASENLEGKFEDRPDIESRIHNSLGFLFGQLGSPELAERHHMREWEIAEAENGAFSIDAARMMHSVVGSLARQGRDEEAIELTQRQLRVIDGLGTPEADVLRPRAIGNLGALIVRVGRFREAVPVLEETLEQKREIYGDRHPTTLSTLNNLASVLSRIGETDRAIVLAVEAHEGRKDVLGVNDPRTFVSLLNLASALTNADRFDESLPMLRDGVERATDGLGSDHPTTVDISTTYARSLFEHGDLAEAERVVRSCISVQKQSDPGMIQARTLSAFSVLASILNKQTKHEAALDLTSEVLELLRNSGREEHQLMPQLLRLHGQVLTSLGQFSEAEAALMEAQTVSDHADEESPQFKAFKTARIELYEAWFQAEPSPEIEAKLQQWKKKHLSTPLPENGEP
ncbi:MAG: tetratricopeptide repeat protein [Phycisphaerales bacterium]